MTTNERDSLVLFYLERVKPLLRAYAASAHLDYDDLYQDASIVVMRCLERKPGEAHSLQAYIHTSVRNRIIDKIRYNQVRQAASLDAPLLHGESNTTLADLLPSAYSTDPLSVVLLKERLLARLPIGTSGEVLL